MASLHGGAVEIAEMLDSTATDTIDNTFWSTWRKKIRKFLRFMIQIVVVILVLVYIAFALCLNFTKSIPVLVIASFVVFSMTYSYIKRCYGERVSEFCGRLKFPDALDRIIRNKISQIFLYVVAVLGMVSYAVITNLHSIQNLVSMCGIAVLIFMSWCISFYPSKINWRPVIWGLALQLLLGIFVLQTNVGKVVFSFLGREVEGFLSHITAGAKFVFGEKYMEFEFAFKLMPTVIFINSSVSVLYHFGLMQSLVEKIGILMHVTMGTTAAETVCCAACIFLGQPEASFLIRPYLSVLTRSELHAIMTAGFASVTADMFGLFVSYGISSSHILTAALMSAPAGLAVSKIVCPETEESKTKTWRQIQNLDTRSGSNNVIDAAGKGAVDAVYVVFAVCSTLIAFLSILHFLNSLLGFLGSLVNIEHLTFDLVLSHVMMPLVFLMGVPWADCRIVGEVVGIKTVINEFVGYLRLGDYIARHQISLKSQVIATYALCGFSNPTTVGVTLSGLGTLLPERRTELSNLVIRAWISGSIACFLTACFAGLFYDEVAHRDLFPDLKTTNATIISNLTST